MNKIIIFHGGCHGCTRQIEEKEGVDFCRKCRYFDADWSLPDYSNRKPSAAEVIKQRIKEKYGMAKRRPKGNIIFDSCYFD